MTQLTLGIVPPLKQWEITSRQGSRPTRWIDGGGSRFSQRIVRCSQRGLSRMSFRTARITSSGHAEVFSA